MNGRYTREKEKNQATVDLYVTGVDTRQSAMTLVASAAAKP